MVVLDMVMPKMQIMIIIIPANYMVIIKFTMFREILVDEI